MLCPKCGKESNNIRVCAFCHTPYPTSTGTPRSTRSVPGVRESVAGPAADPRIAMERRGRIRRWTAIGALAVFTVGTYIATRERVIPVGVALPDLITVPMSAADAARLLKVSERNTEVTVNGNDVTVKISFATFPERRDGQLALAQQYARADALVQGHKRTITFIDPTGVPFAKADPTKGVVMTR
jgi:hypothetical protein